MPNKNKHIEEYLRYYLKLSNSPEFAVLIRGAWGSGKSWFIKDFFKTHKKEELIHLSLNGISSYKEIEEIFFQQIHPLLSSKGMKVAGKILSSIAKTAINFDFNGDNSKDASISSAIPDIKLAEYFTNADKRTLIFDDLERCSININDVLGYINQFVENNGLKVIIIANEEEIIRCNNLLEQEAKAKYLQIKEKVIGKSFDVQPDFMAAITAFIELLSNKDVQALLTKIKTKIEELFLSSEYFNLRHLRHTILDFERFFTFLPKNIDEKAGLLEEIICTFFAISFEIRKGIITESEVSEIFSNSRFSKKEEDSKINKIRSKYQVFDNLYNPINGDLWVEFFKVGSLNKDGLKDSIFNSNYYINERTSKWIRLWHIYDLEDIEFESIYKEVFTQLNSADFEDPYILLHVVGILLSLSEDRFIKLTKKEITHMGKKAAKTMLSNGKLVINKHNDFPDRASYGLGYSGQDSKEFISFTDFLKFEINKNELDNFKVKGKELIDLMSTSASKFIQRIILSNSDENLYYDIPILSFIEIDDFKNVFVNMPNREKKLIGFRLEARYKNDVFSKKLLNELPWLKKLKAALKKEYQSKAKSISSYQFEKVMMPALDKSIAHLEKNS